MYDENTPPPSTINAIRTCLDANQQLKKLDLIGELLFSEDFLSTISCQLTEFDFTCFDNSLQIRQNLNLFLVAQSKSLEVLRLREWMGIEVMKTVSLMPRLKKLALHGSYADPSEYEANEFPQCLLVTTLYLSQPDLKFEWYKILLKAFTNLESLGVLVMTDKIADLIPETCRSLRQLLVYNFKAQNVRRSNEAFYVNLEEFKCFRVDRLGSNELLDRLNGRVGPLYTDF